MTGDWPTWALQFLIVLGMGRVWLAIDKNTDSLAKLREEIPKTYATKEDVKQHHNDDENGFKGMRSHLSELRDRVWTLDNRLSVIDGGVKEAQAGLRAD